MAAPKPQPQKQQTEQSGEDDPQEVVVVEKVLRHALALLGGDATMPIAAVEAKCPALSRSQVGLALNYMAQRHRIEFMQDPENPASTHVRLLNEDPEILKQLHDLDVKHRLIFQLIERSNDKGMWARDLRFRSNLQYTEITRVLKTLESRKLIKSVTSVAAKNRKVYLLYDVSPSVEVTGDVWYSGSDLDRGFIDGLSHAVLEVIQAHGPQLAVQAVFDLVERSGISKQKLQLQNILEILEVLVFQGRVERTFPVDDHDVMVRTGSAIYRLTNNSVLQANGLTDAPCGTCPVIQECAVGAVVSPETCPYIEKYSDF